MAAWFAPLIARLAAGMASGTAASGGGGAAGGAAAASRFAANAERGIKVAERLYRPIMDASRAVKPITETQLGEKSPEERRQDRAGDFKAVAQLMGLTGAAYAATKALEAFARNQMDNAADLMKFHAAVLRSVLQLQRQEYLLKFKTAAATAGSTQDLSQAIQSLNEAQQPGKELWTNVKNEFATLTTELLAGMREIGNLVIRPLNELVKKITGGKGYQELPVKGFLRQIGANDWTSEPENIEAQKPPPTPAAIQARVLSFQWPTAWKMASERAAKTERPSKE